MRVTPSVAFYILFLFSFNIFFPTLSLNINTAIIDRDLCTGRYRGERARAPLIANRPRCSARRMMIDTIARGRRVYDRHYIVYAASTFLR